MTTNPLRKLGDKVYCKSFAKDDLYHVEIIKIISPAGGRYPYQVQQIGTSFTWWISEAHIPYFTPRYGND